MNRSKLLGTIRLVLVVLSLTAPAINGQGYGVVTLQEFTTVRNTNKLIDSLYSEADLISTVQITIREAFSSSILDDFVSESNDLLSLAQMRGRELTQISKNVQGRISNFGQIMANSPYLSESNNTILRLLDAQQRLRYAINWKQNEVVTLQGSYLAYFGILITLLTAVAQFAYWILKVIRSRRSKLVRQMDREDEAHDVIVFKEQTSRRNMAMLFE